MAPAAVVWSAIASVSYTLAWASSLQSQTSAIPAGAWAACRASDVAAAGQDGTTLSLPSWTPLAACLRNATVPGTALTNLINNGTFSTPGPSPVVITDPYVDDYLRFIPDINATGPAFWTFWYQTTIPSSAVSGCGSAVPPQARVTLTVMQATYRTTMYLDGQVVPPLGAADGVTDAVGMYKRHQFLLPGTASSFCSAPTHGLAILVLPPDNYGQPNIGQGGDHKIAQDLTNQDSAGWDWVVAMPDRGVGIHDPVYIDIQQPGVLVSDPAVAVTDLVLDNTNPTSAQSLNASFRVSLQNLDTASGATGIVTVTVPGLDVNISWPVALPIGDGSTVVEVDSPSMALSNVNLWWPHTLGPPSLYNASVTFTRTDGQAPYPSTSIFWRAGLRTLNSTVDPTINARVFYVNGVRMWVVGGNYIATDQMHRTEYRSAERYSDEIRAHAEMGLNIIRLWGGHGGHADHLWRAADEQGVMLFQEFWMSGDCNGRWAGNYSWPIDHSGYIDAIADTIRRLRGHPSLFLYNAGNELWPLNQSPPSDIRAAFPDLISALEPRTETTYVQSSMGSNGYNDFMPEYVLAPNDGNYGINDERLYFIRNPGLNGSATIGFQPEIGNTAHPEYESLCRFMSTEAREALPTPNSRVADLRATGDDNIQSGTVDSRWTWHNYLPFTDGLDVDHIYRLSPANTTTGWNASEYSAAAGVAQFAQYQALFEGFGDAMGAWYQSVIMWKSAGPWPAFRGALYDFYLAQSGGYWGTRAATGAGRPLHVQISRGNASLSVINYGLTDSTQALSLTVRTFDVTAGTEHPLVPPVSAPVGAVPRGTVLHVQQTMQDPPTAVPGSTLLWRVDLTSTSNNALVSRSEYLLNTISTDFSVHQDFSALVKARGGVMLGLTVTAVGTVTAAPSYPGALVTVPTAFINVTLVHPGLNPSASSQVAMALTVSLRCPAAAVTAATGFVDDRVLPQWPSDGFFTLMPRESKTVTIEAPLRFLAQGAPTPELEVVTRGWNAGEQRVQVTLQ